MKDYYNLRFGYCEDDSESDFIDNINGKLNIHVAKGYDGESRKSIFCFFFIMVNFYQRVKAPYLTILDTIVNSFSKLDSRFSEIAKGSYLVLV